MAAIYRFVSQGLPWRCQLGLSGEGSFCWTIYFPLWLDFWVSWEKIPHLFRDNGFLSDLWFCGSGHLYPLSYSQITYTPSRVLFLGVGSLSYSCPPLHSPGMVNAFKIFEWKRCVYVFLSQLFWVCIVRLFPGREQVFWKFRKCYPWGPCMCWEQTQVVMGNKRGPLVSRMSWEGQAAKCVLTRTGGSFLRWGFQREGLLLWYWWPRQHYKAMSLSIMELNHCF